MAATAFALAAIFSPVSSNALAAAQAMAFNRVEIGALAPDFTLNGADNKPHRLSEYRGKVVVLEWTSPVCAYTKSKYSSGQMQALQRTAADRGMIWLSINTSQPRKPGYLTAARARARVTSTKARITAFLLDKETRVGHLYGAKTTPSFFIIGKDGALAYQGAIDDDVYANGHVTRNYVSEALDAINAGRPIIVPETRPYGCGVEY